MGKLLFHLYHYRRVVFSLLLAAFLFLASAESDMARVYGVIVMRTRVSCAAACADSNITFFWDCEDLSINTTQDCNSGDYSAGDDSAVGAGLGEDINASAKLYGTNGCDFYSSADRYNFTTDVTNMIDGQNDGKVGLWFRVNDTGNGWTDGRGLFTGKVNATGYGLFISLDGTDEVRACWYDSGGWGCNATDDVGGGFNGSLDTWYFLEVGFDANDNKIYIEIDDTTYVDGAANTMDALAIDRIFVGDYSGVAGDTHTDNVMIANDETIDLFQYSNDEAYNSCQ